MTKATLPYGNIVRQEIQLIPDTKNKSFLPWVSTHLISGGIRDEKKVYFTKWEKEEDYVETKTIQMLPINENFDAITRVYGSMPSVKNIAEDRYVTFDCPKSKKIATDGWTCLINTNKTIHSNEVCDGKPDCCPKKEKCFDNSDEEPEICKGANNKWVLLSKHVCLTILAIGYFVTIFICLPAIYKTRWSSVKKSDALDEPENRERIDAATFNSLFQVCKNFMYEMHFLYIVMLIKLNSIPWRRKMV